MEPLLIVGLGGVGSLIAQAARRRMLKEPTTKADIDRGIVQFLIIDTAAQCWAPDLASRYSDLEPGFSARTVIDELRQKASFFNRAWGTYDPGVVTEGSQVRAVGRLAYLRKAILRDANVLSDRVRSAYQEALGYWNSPGLGSATQRRLTIAFCGSAAGGTCSGTLPDLAFALRAYVTAQGGIDPKVLAFLLDHEAVAMNRQAAADERRLQTNHAALMLELEYWMNPGWGEKQANQSARYDVSYPGAGPLAPFTPANDARDQTPIDLVFHVCRTFSDGSPFNSHEEDHYLPLVDLAGEALFTMARSGAGAGLANFATAAANMLPSENDMTNRHGSFGLMALRVPIDAIQEHLAQGLGRSVVAHAAGDPEAALRDADTSADTIIEQLRLREIDHDDVVDQIAMPRTDTPVWAPPDPTATLTNADAKTWQSDLTAWASQYEGWKKALTLAADKNAQALTEAVCARTGDSIGGRILNSLSGQNLAFAIALADALTRKLSAHRNDLINNDNQGLTVLEQRLGKNGDLGENRETVLRNALGTAYGRVFNRGADAAKSELAIFLNDRKDAQQSVILQTAARQVLDSVIEDAKEWHEICLWLDASLFKNANAAQERLARGRQPLSMSLNISSPAPRKISALEMNVLGSADVVDTVVRPVALGSTTEEQLVDSSSKTLLSHAERGVAALATRAKVAKQTARQKGDARPWTDLAMKAQNGDLALELAAFAESLCIDAHASYLRALTLDDALRMEADFVIDKRRGNWADIVDETGVQRLNSALQQGQKAAKDTYIEMRLNAFVRKVMLACQQSNVRGAGGGFYSKVSIVTGSQQANPMVWASLGRQIVADTDDRSAEAANDPQSLWRSGIVLTQVAYGVDLWWFESFQKSLRSYNWWLASRDGNGNRLPVHTDIRFYTREWPIELPPSEDNDDLVAKFFELYAAQEVVKAEAAGYFKLRQDDKMPEDRTLGRGWRESTTAILRDAKLGEMIRVRRSRVDEKLRQIPYPASAHKFLADEAVRLAREEYQNTGNDRRAAQKMFEAVSATKESFEKLNSGRLDEEQVRMSAQNVDIPSLVRNTLAGTR